MKTMKTFKLLLSLLFLAGISMAQQVDREKVLVELGTGTW